LAFFGLRAAGRSDLGGMTMMRVGGWRGAMVGGITWLGAGALWPAAGW
jgi:hypothetical protein